MVLDISLPGFLEDLLRYTLYSSFLFYNQYRIFYMCNQINSSSFIHSRARGDMIEVYKYLHGQYNVEEVPLLLDEIRMTRGHSRRLKKERMETRQRRNHFRHRTVNRWNSLTEEVVSAPSLNSFKSRLDELWRGYSYIQNDCFPVRTHREDQLTGF